jgi:hypothetical protein
VKDDDEARYLIDQFNKYASWALRPIEMVFPAFAIMVAVIVFYASLVSHFFSEDPIQQLSTVFWVVFVVVLSYVLLRMIVKHQKLHIDLILRLAI